MNFDQAFDRLIGHEGQYVDNQFDPGGETNWGISKRSYPNEDIKHLTRNAAKEIYKRDFWDRIHADRMPPSVSFQVFDFAVNSGIETAVRYLQCAVSVADDGHWGPVSQSALDLTSENDILMRLNAYRLMYMTSLLHWPKFGRGWARRVANNLLFAANDNEEGA